MNSTFPRKPTTASLYLTMALWASLLGALTVGSCAVTPPPIPPTVAGIEPPGPSGEPAIAVRPVEPPVTPSVVPAVAPVKPVDPKKAGLEMAAALLKSGQADKAADKLGELAAANPDAPEIKRLQAAAFASSGRLAESRSTLDALIAARPDDVASMAMAVDIARFQGDEKGRKAYLDKAVAVAPADSAVLASWGKYWLDQKAWANAEAAYRKATLADPRNPDAFQGLGLALYRMGKFADSEAALDSALVLEPGNAYAWSDRSKTRYQLGKYAEAESDLGKAIENAPDSSWAYMDRARFRLDTNRYSEAESDLDAAISREPDYFLAYLYRAAVYEKTGRDDKALADYDRVIALQPEYWYALESAGSCAFRLGDWAAASDRFQKAFVRAPLRYDYSLVATIALFRLGKPGEGKALAAKVAPGIDREKYPMQWLALRLLQDQNDLTAELETRIQSEKRLDLKAAALFWLGEYWIVRGRSDLGMKYLQLAHDMGREGTLEDRLLSPEIDRIAKAGGRG